MNQPRWGAPRERRPGVPSGAFRRAFTLIELMVALAILAVALVTLILSRNTSIAEASIAKNARLSYTLLSAKMGEILSVKDLEQESPYDSGSFEGLPGYSWERTIEKEEVAGTGDPDNNRDPKEILKITLTVHYPIEMTEEEQANLSLVAYRLKDGDDANAVYAPAGATPAGQPLPGAEGTPKEGTGK
ncbi:MAG: prepilin-type N-terminal cleavage/methylation domain-containing protein [Planctomycetes bacterium]|nr:prepilin-type N-terminal cleavage/methylation domain-containing protein [Planctomycetota bacterium]